MKKNKSKFVVQATYEVGKHRIEDMFIGAVEGGSTYWCDKLRPLKGNGCRYHNSARPPFTIS